jgi:phosphohistidine phosphatase SixA
MATTRMHLPTRRLITLGALAAAVSPARAAPFVVLMRHATAPGTGDPPGFVLGFCATQRNLSAEGRAEAVGAGAFLRRAGIRVDRLLSSRWCRCQETARLLDLGPVEDFPPLDSFYADAAEGPARTEAVKTLLRDNPDRRIALVTHQVNITALTGIFPRPAEIILAQVGTRPSDPVTVVDRIIAA